MASFIGQDCFVSLIPHMLDCNPLENHLVLLIKSVCEKYLQVRYFYAAKEYSAHLKNQKSKFSRQRSNKLIIFAGL